MEALWIVYNVISFFLYAFDFLLLVHAICSWVPEWRMSKVYILSSKIIDPILRPIRRIMMRFDWARRCPIDLSFIVLVILTRVADRIIWYIFRFIILLIQV